MVLRMGLKRSNQIYQRLALAMVATYKSSTSYSMSIELLSEIDHITKVINEHPFPDQPLKPALLQLVPPTLLSTAFTENVLGRLFAAHSNGLKALEFFKYCLQQPQFTPTSDAFEKTLHILTRMRYFDKAWVLMADMKKEHPSLLTLKSMNIMLSKIAKFQSYEETLAAFGRMETDIFVERRFGSDEFNVLLQAFCTLRKMKEAQSVFKKFILRFSPNAQTMNILLLGFKESGDITAMDLFYHDIIRRGFKPNMATYSVRIDAYCKRGCFGDGLRLLEEMERVHSLPPTLDILTTLIHGAGVVRNTLKARQLFDEIPKRGFEPDNGAYNALISSLVRSRDIKSAMELMDEMKKRQIGHDNVTYHTMFSGMRSVGIEGVCMLYKRMIESNFVPETRTVGMLVKYFCANQRLDLGFHLWTYLVEKGYCPHNHVLELLVTGFCSCGRLQEAFQCSKQMLERGRQLSEAGYLMLERYLLQSNETEKLEELNRMIKKLQTVLPPKKEACCR